MNSEEHMKGITVLAGIWLVKFIAMYLDEIHTGVSILASLAAFVASIFYARYYWMKTKKER